MNLLEENASSPEKFWKCIKQLFPVKNPNASVCTSIQINGIMTNHKQSIANEFCRHFSTIANTLKGKFLKVKDFIWGQPIPDKYNKNSVFNFQHVSVPTVAKHLKNLKCMKATGLDGIPSRLLKDGSKHIAKPLAHIINTSLITGIVPSDFKRGKIIPIHKSGKKSDVDNYRPITILPVISKVLEKCVFSQIITYLEINKMLSSQQFGFRKNRSTELTATLLLDDIRKEMNEGNLCGAVFIDLRKAFDTISHSSIITKLPEYGITGNEKEWITNYLFGRTQCVIYESCTSSVYPVLCGVPQGSILGPLLFLLHFNGVYLPLKHCRILMYADDTVLYYAHKEVSVIEEKLTEDLSRLSEWFEQNELMVNLKKGKTECMVFGTGKNLSKNDDHVLNIKIKEEVVNNATSYSYLGIILDPTLCLGDHFNKIYKRASDRVRLLWKLRQSMSMNSTAKVYNAMVMPVIMYCSRVNFWSCTTRRSKLESLERRVRSIIFQDENPSKLKVKISSEGDCQRKKICTITFRCLKMDLCENFENYFDNIDSKHVTRNNKSLIRLPKVRLECAKKSFYFTGAKTSNDLPIDIRKVETLNDFKVKLQNFLNA